MDFLCVSVALLAIVTATTGIIYGNLFHIFGAIIEGLIAKSMFTSINNFLAEQDDE